MKRLLAVLLLCGCAANKVQLERRELHITPVFVGDIEADAREALRAAQRYMLPELNTELWLREPELVETFDASCSEEGLARAKATRGHSGGVLVLKRALPFPLRLFQLVRGCASPEGQIAWVLITGDAEHSGKLIAHELAHLVGVGHSASGIMFPDVTFLSLATGFSADSVEERQ